MVLLVATFLPNIALFTVAFWYWKCYYSLCFKESDSWNMIFDIGGSRKIAAVGLESWKVGEFGSEGVGE